ncbi:MAG: hypothetical protein ACTSX6_04035 [Candidatus Heimdallarchaeaceae archaeon]
MAKEKALPTKLKSNVKKRRQKGMGFQALKREEAFNYYKKLGSVRKVAEIPGMPSYKDLLRWKEEDKWDERIEKSRENLQKWEGILAKIESDSIVKDDVAQLMLLNFIFEKTIRAIFEKELEPSTWKEAMDTIKMIFEQKRLLMGRPGSKAELSIDLASMDEHEIRKVLRQVETLISELGSPHSPEEQVKELVRQKVELEKVLEEKETGEGTDKLELNKPDGGEVIDVELDEIEDLPEGGVASSNSFDDVLKEMVNEEDES